jgi:hypothetical protein
MQSGWHNLPTFGGIMQRDGEAFAARDVAVDLGRASMSMDIAGAYPPEAGIRSYRRSVTLEKGRGVTIEDVHDGDKPAELSLMFAQEPRVETGRIVLPDLAEISVEGAGPMRIETIAIDDARLRAAWPERLYRVLVPIAGTRLKLTIS